MMSESFRDLIAWQRGMTLVTEIYRATTSFPEHERYGLTNQLRRASAAIPSDIAEGKGRLSKKEFLQMLSRARGSCFEVQTQLEIARNLEMLSPDAYEHLEPKAAEVGRLLNGLMTNLQQQISNSHDRIRDAESPDEL